MAEVKHIEVFNCSVEQFFEILIDYKKYPEFLKEVKEVNILADEGDTKKVEFKISVVKSFAYTNEQKEVRPDKVSWEFLSGDLFKKMRGHWALTDEGGKTRAEYFVEAQFGMFIPKTMTKTVISANLPAMMKAYHQRVAELYGN